MKGNTIMTSAVASQAGSRSAGRVMGRPTILIRGEVLTSDPAKIDREAGIATVSAKMVEGPTHVAGRVAQIEIPVNVLMKMVTRAEAMSSLSEVDGIIDLDGSLAGMVINVYADSGSGREEFHVHSESCPGNRGYGDQKPWVARVESKQDIIQVVYNPKVFKYDPDDAAQVAMYGEDIQVHSCLKTLDVSTRS